jgi:hypothetical protein
MMSILKSSIAEYILNNRTKSMNFIYKVHLFLLDLLTIRQDLQFIKHWTRSDILLQAHLQNIS